MGVEHFLAITLLLFLGVLCVSLYYNYKHAILILNVIDNVEESLDLLDDKYRSISEILEIPLFYDSPQIRQVVADIKECQDSILFVANEIGRLEETQDGEEEDR